LPIKGHQKILTPALYLQVDNGGIINDDGPDSQIMRGYCHNLPITGVWHQKWTTHTQGIGCRSGRGGNQQTISLIAVQVIAIDKRMNVDHGRIVTLEDGNFIERAGVLFKNSAIHL
jgi:hypothetical protein